MHVRLASSGRARRLSLAGFPGPRILRLLSALALCATPFAGGCTEGAPSGNVAVDWRIIPAPPLVGPGTLTLHLSDAARQPVRGAALRLEAHMSHPGMAPVLASFVEREDGRYEAAIEFTMAGDWILLVSGAAPGHGTIEHRIDVRGVRNPG